MILGLVKRNVGAQHVTRPRQTSLGSMGIGHGRRPDPPGVVRRYPGGHVDARHKPTLPRRRLVVQRPRQGAPIGSLGPAPSIDTHRCNSESDGTHIRPRSPTDRLEVFSSMSSLPGRNLPVVTHTAINPEAGPSLTPVPWTPYGC